jgi:hypothetical protein
MDGIRTLKKHTIILEAGVGGYAVNLDEDVLQCAVV